MNLTLEQFQATRTWCDDLRAHFNLDGLGAGYLYVASQPGCGLYIEAPAGQNPYEPFHLGIGQRVWTSTDLAELERTLYDYGCQEGHCEVAAQSAIQAQQEKPAEPLTAFETAALRHLALGNHETLKDYGATLESLRKLGFATKRGTSWRLTNDGLKRLAHQIRGVDEL